MLPVMVSNRFLRQRPPAELPRIPAGTRVYAIGDIHGTLAPLRELLRLIQEHAAQHNSCTRNVVVYLGDYVDRGTDSRRVIDLLLGEPLPGFESVHLKGNHEESLLLFLADEQCGPQWLIYGGDATLYSYGVRPPPPTDLAGLKRARLEFSQKLPPTHLDFLRRLSLLHCEGDYVFVHAGVRPRVRLDRQNPEDLLWIREEFLQSDADFGKVIVHGHSISEAPTVRGNRIGIDTGAYASGRLTCLVLEETHRQFLAT